MKSSRYIFIFSLFAGTLQAQQPIIPVGENLVVENIPAIPF
jgi:hypothetical protein